MDHEGTVPPEDDRQWLVQADQQASRDFDKAIMTLAAGALGLSIVFVHDVAPAPQAKPALAVAWSLFALSLLLILVSFLTSMAALRYEIQAIDDPAAHPPRGSSEKCTVILNISAVVSLVMGVAFLLVFAVYNI